ncbi:MAG: sulfatase [Planctomycetota bacterium]|jgi:arylsulfatase A-like enzyme
MKILIQNLFLFFYVFITFALLNTIQAYGNQKQTVCQNDKDFNLVIRNYSEERISATEKIKHSNRPNVLLIGIETLRADHVRHLGYFRNTTPALDNLAKEGVSFSNALATSSWTMPTVMSVFTSLYPSVHRTTDYLKKLPERINTLAEILKENGYVTTAFVVSPVLGRQYGFSKGFDLYDDFTVEQCIAIDLFERNNKIGRSFGNAPTSETLSRIAAGWLRKNHEKPFFMFVFYYDPHYDYSPPPPFDSIFDPNYDGTVDGYGIENEPRKSIRPPQKDLDHIIALYDGEILYTDRHISTLLEKFAEYENLDNTLIVVFGDHGEEFYEHGSTTHGHSLYTEVTHIPLIFRWPSVIPENRCVDALVSQVDIMPTILDYLDIEYKGLIQGDSLKPLINEQKEKLHNMIKTINSFLI